MTNRTTSDNLNTTLKQKFGIPKFRPGQREALDHILAGADTLVVMPTGYGKSLIYQLAALLLPYTTLVISPLISLMKDQVDSLIRNKISASYLNSTLGPVEQADRLRNLSEGSYKILLVAPERLRNRAFKKALTNVPISLLVVDEAHCLSQWGHDFRPDYLHIAEFSHQCKEPVILALTATATLRVQKEIVRLLDREDMKKVITGFNRPNLSFEVSYIPDLTGKLRFLNQFVRDADGAGIVYTGTRRDAEEIAEFISEVVGSSARYYHAGLGLQSRNEVQDLFMSGDLTVVAATNAFGMGIDRPDVRFVIHYSMPGSLEAYYQEAGRAGRDGKPARAVLIYSPDDTALQEFFINNDSPTIDELRLVHKFVTNLPTSSHESEKGIRTFHLDDLTYVTSLSEVKARVAIEQIEAARGFTRQTNETGNLIRIRTRDLSDNELQRISSIIESRRRHKRAVLKKMVTYAETNDCRRRTILDYFGDTSTSEILICCDNCISRIETDEGELRSEISDLAKDELIILDTISKVRWGIGKRKISQILKGSSAKGVAGYKNHLYYGIFNGQKIKEIESVIEELVQEGYIKYIGNLYPTLALTPKGEFTLTKAGPAQLEKLAKWRKAQQHKTDQEYNNAVTRIHPDGKSKPKDRAAHVHSLGVSGRLDNIPELITALKDPNGNVRRLAASALGKIRSSDAVMPLLALLEVESKPQVRQYSIVALGKIEDERACARLEKITNDHSEKEYNRSAARNALQSLKRTEAKPSELPSSGNKQVKSSQIDRPGKLPRDPITAFLNQPRPRPLKGPWLAGWALDYHSRYVGSNQIRSAVGDLVYKYKYKGEHHLANNLVQLWIDLLAQHPDLPQPHAVIPIPSSTLRTFDPVPHLAQVLASSLDIPAMINTLGKTRTTRPQKELNSLVAKQRNVSGAFRLNVDVAGKHLLLVDDLYDSGATLCEAVRTLARGQPASIVVLTLTKTIHSNL